MASPPTGLIPLDGILDFMEPMMNHNTSLVQVPCSYDDSLLLNNPDKVLLDIHSQSSDLSFCSLLVAPKDFTSISTLPSTSRPNGPIVVPQILNDNGGDDDLLVSSDSDNKQDTKEAVPLDKIWVETSERIRHPRRTVVPEEVLNMTFRERNNAAVRRHRERKRMERSQEIPLDDKDFKALQLEHDKLQREIQEIESSNAELHQKLATFLASSKREG